MACKDKSITFLKGFGYNVVRLPKADISPLQIFVIKKGILQPLGELTTVFVGNDNTKKIPTIKKNVQVAALQGQKTNDLSVGIGISILGGVIGAMGGSSLGLDAAYKNARSIVFSYGEILEDSIQVSELDIFLANSDVNPSSRHVADLLEADEIVVLTAVIKSKTISVEAKKKDNADLKVEVPVIKEIIGGNVGVASNNESENAISFTGAIPLGFGFKAVRLFFEGGSYKRFDPIKDGGAAISLDAIPGTGGTSFLTESTFATISN